jgi:uncharacterized protein YcaQ
MARALSLHDMRRYAVARSLFEPRSLADAIAVLGFVQADPIRAPARAQDLTLRHRVVDYRAGDLERLYPELDIEEDAFINYGFVTRDTFRLMHPRVPRRRFGAATRRRADALLAFVRERGEAHPRDVDLHFAHGSVRNYWGGSSNATTHLLDAMHYRGLLRIVRRDNGIRVYAARHPGEPTVSNPALRRERLDALVDIVVQKYAPLPAVSLARTLRRLRYGAPQLAAQIPAAIARARKRLAHARIDDIDWYWPANEDARAVARVEDDVRLLAPFDPIVWDRTRFELFWNWAYRFEAYTPVAKRKLGYYALPLLWRNRVIGWGNLSLDGARVASDIGFVAGRAPRERVFSRELERELGRMAAFLHL